MYSYDQAALEEVSHSDNEFHMEEKKVWLDWNDKEEQQVWDTSYESRYDNHQ